MQQRPERRFPFGHEPVPAPTERTAPLPPRDTQQTAPLAGFLPPAHALPFRTPFLPPPLPESAPVQSSRPLAQPAISLKHKAALVLLVLDIAVLLYLALTWRS